MSLKTAFVSSLMIAIVVAAAGPAPCQSTSMLNVCQELVSSARSYEARAAGHSRIAKALMAQIESMAKLSKSEAQVAAMDNLFAQYDENRALENKFRSLYRQAAEESERCMKASQ